VTQDTVRTGQLEHILEEVIEVLGQAPATDVVLDRIADLAVGLVEGAEEAGLSLVEGREITTVADTSYLAHAVDRIQMETGEGPSLDRLDDGGAVVVEDLTSGGNWSYFSPRAASKRVGSMLVLPVSCGRDRLALLSLYAHEENAFSDNDVETGRALARLSCVVLASMEVNARTELQTQQLKEALESRDIIGQAKGILMSSHQCTADDAFEMLRVGSQNLNKKLRDVAADLVDETERKIEKRRA
jgi:transcriptional regulator with GAF, ATPase, and Fis domain